jgi:prevent-host-death family protein
MSLSETMTLTAAKARLSELVSRLMHKRDKIFITRKGKPVAVLMPLEAYRELAGKGERGLAAARGALADLDTEIDEMCDNIYRDREKSKDRDIPL